MVFCCLKPRLVCFEGLILVLADLVGLGIEVPQVLVPEHPAVVDGVAVGPVVVAIAWVCAPSVVSVVSLYLQRVNN